MPDDRTAVIELQEVRRDYCRDDGSLMVRALDDCCLRIDSGEYVCIMGPSGSGKSTLMNILGCLDRPTSGRFLLRGRDVAQLDDEALSTVRGREVGFVFQSFNLIPELTVLENVEVPLFYRGVHRSSRHERAATQLERVGLADRMDHRPNQLSGGQQQRAAIARALVGDPSILLADEPTGNLDSATGEAIMELIEALHGEGRTVIMVTHDDDIAERVQRVVKLRDGRIDVDRRNAPG
ncbi:MAG: ABC transporter ATP-binding protein [Phycisphaerales bacterium]|nr:ABC transporter ATP-binding protein [Phycisphaerales bacterium]